MVQKQLTSLLAARSPKGQRAATSEESSQVSDSMQIHDHPSTFSRLPRHEGRTALIGELSEVINHKVA